MRIGAFIFILLFCFGFGVTQDATAEYELLEFKDQGIILLNNGDTLKGEILYWPNKHERVWIDVGNTGGKRREIKPSNVKFFHLLTMNRSFEAAQEIRDNGKASDSAFYERMNPEQSKFRIYQQFNGHGKIVGGKMEGHISFFVAIPGHLAITELSSKPLRPFNEKMPVYLSDCPTLSDKVKNEEKGYKIPTLTNNYKRLEVLRTIASEYEGCGK